MHNAERCVIYTALTLLVGANLAALLPDRPVAADPQPRGETVGPADSLHLAGEGDDLVVANRSGRLSWADNDHARAYSIAFVHVGRIVGPLLEQSSYTEERDALEKEITDRDRELTEQAQAMQQTPGFNPAAPEAQQLAQAMERWRIERQQRLGKLGSEQVERAYRDLVEAVQVVADEREIDLVLRFIPTADPFLAVSAPQAYTAIRGRTALRYPDALDVTDAVLEELDVE